MTIVDKLNHHLFQPLLYQVAAGALSPSDCAAPIRPALKRSPNTSLLMAEATDVDADGARSSSTAATASTTTA